MRSSDSGEKNDDQLVSESGEILQGKQKMKTSPMSDDKQAQSTKQGGAPEGDRATAGQAAQPTGEQQQDGMAATEAGDEKSAGAEGQTGQAPGGPQEVSTGWEVPSSDTNPAMDPAESKKYTERETQGSTQVPSSERETQGDVDASNKGMAGAVGGAGGYGGGASEFGEGMDQMRAQGSSGGAEPGMKSASSSSSSDTAGRAGSVDGMPEGRLAAGDDAMNVGRAESAGAATSDSTAERVAQVYGVGAEAGAGVEEAEVYKKEAGQEDAGDEGARKAFEGA
ncbi:hypothetical protein OEZ86_013720 [Tetradesmus obliquus]|nr:hypothetical protein OEZ86_013720 [Tetradesmus obliquus]